MWCMDVSYHTILGLYFSCENSPKEAYISDIREYGLFLRKFLKTFFPIAYVSILYDADEYISFIATQRPSDYYQPMYLLNGSKEFGTIIANKKPKINGVIMRMLAPYKEEDSKSKFFNSVIEFTNKYLFCKNCGLTDDFKTDEEKWKIIFEQCDEDIIYRRK